MRDANHALAMGLSGLRTVLDLLPPRSRQRMYLLLALYGTTALSEVASVTSVLPLVTAATDPTALQSNPWLLQLSQVSGLTEPRSVMAALSLLFVGLYALATGLTALTYYQCLVFSTDVSQHLSTALLTRYVHRPHAWFFSRNTTELLRRVITDTHRVVDNIVLPLVRGLSYITTVVAVCVGLLVIDPVVAVISAVGVSLLYLATYRFFAARVSAMGKRARGLDEQRHRLAAESLAVFKGARIGPRRRVFMARFTAVNRAYFNLTAVHDAIDELPRYVTEIVAVSAIIAVFAFVVWSGRPPASAVSLVFLYIMAVWRVVPALQRVYRSAVEIGYHRPALDHMREELLDVAHLTPEVDGPRLALTRRIVLRGVGRVYEGREAAALRDVDLDIVRGATVALVGPSGCGKSTLADILTGYLAPTAGSVEIDDAALEGERVPAWQRNVGYVPQDVFLVDDTVTRNVALGIADADIDAAAVERACRQARVHDLVRSLAHGYDTVLGERGVCISGGQRQRIGIARALYHDPELLVLDEATSALDGRVEGEVIDTVRALAPSKTVVIIAHRLSTVERCDEVVLLDEGRLVGRGTYATLVAEHPLMQALACARGTDAAL